MPTVMTRRHVIREPTHRARVRFAANTTLLVIAAVAWMSLILAYMVDFYG
jgi:hypothetical protein